MEAATSASPADADANAGTVARLTGARSPRSLSTDNAMTRLRSISGNTYTSTTITMNASAMPVPMRTIESP